MGFHKNQLIEHIENCEKCSVLEELRDKLTDYVKLGIELRIEDIFTAIDDFQIECCTNARKN